MLRKICHAMYVLIGVTIGLWLGGTLFAWLDYRRNPGMYDMQNSAPWYTRIIVLSVACGIALLVEILVQSYVHSRLNKESSGKD